MSELPLVGLWRELGELGAGVLSGGHWGRQRRGWELAQVGLAGAERAAATGDAGGGRARRGVGGAGGAVAELPVEAPHRGRLEVQGVVDEDLGRPRGHGMSGVQQGVPRRRGRWAGQGALAGPIVDRHSGLGPGQSRRQSGGDGWRAVRPPGTHLEKNLKNTIAKSELGDLHVKTHHVKAY